MFEEEEFRKIDAKPWMIPLCCVNMIKSEAKRFRQSISTMMIFSQGCLIVSEMSVMVGYICLKGSSATSYMITMIEANSGLIIQSRVSL